MSSFLVDLRLAERVLEMGEDHARHSPGGAGGGPSASSAPPPDPFAQVPAGLRDLMEP